MFQIAKRAQGPGGAFVKLAQLDSDDFVVVVRRPREVGLAHKYVGPDFYKAEDVFNKESQAMLKAGTLDQARGPLRPGKSHE
jgi:hypothetical protein